VIFKQIPNSKGFIPHTTLQYSVKCMQVCRHSSITNQLNLFQWATHFGSGWVNETTFILWEKVGLSVVWVG